MSYKTNITRIKGVYNALEDLRDRMVFVGAPQWPYMPKLLAAPYFFEWVDAHATFGSPPATYFIQEKLEAFARMK